MTSSSEKWFHFTAVEGNGALYHNAPAYFGFGTKVEADKYLDALNSTQRVGSYSYREMTAEESTSLDSGDDTDGFRLDEALAS